MKVSIEIIEAIDGKFSDIKLCYKNTENIVSKIALNIPNFSNVFDFTQDLKSIKFDFFVISALVYGIDNLISREIYSVDGWARELEVELPVYNLKKWKENRKVLEDALNFLTGDYWNIEFILNQTDAMFIEKARRWEKNIRVYENEKIKSVSLFSGGLDSLIGVIDELEVLAKDEKILFVSHFDFKSSGPNKDQYQLFNDLQNKYPNQIYWLQTKLALSRKNQYNTKVKLESNYRSRSLFFIGLGVYLSPTNNLLIPENGTISINYPLTPSRVCSLSTRTTHPFVINKLQELLDKCGIDVKLSNPYSFMTKGEMFIKCKGKQVLKNIFEKSVSCGKRGRKQYWSYTKTGTDHCGVCMPCVYRRAALNKAKLDTQLYGNKIEDSETINSYVDLPALLSYLKKNISHEKMQRDLLVNGSIPFKDLEEYSKLVLRSKLEVLQFFKDKGNKFVKSQLGIK